MTVIDGDSDAGRCALIDVNSVLEACALPALTENQWQLIRQTDKDVAVSRAVRRGIGGQLDNRELLERAVRAVSPFAQRVLTSLGLASDQAAVITTALTTGRALFSALRQIEGGGDRARDAENFVRGLFPRATQRAEPPYRSLKVYGRGAGSMLYGQILANEPQLTMENVRLLPG